MAAKKDFTQCPHCGRQQDESEGTAVTDAGFRYLVTTNAWHRISCFCGVMTRLFRFKAQLQSCWNSRPGKPVKMPTVQVKQPKTLHVPPSDIPDEF